MRLSIIRHKVPTDRLKHGSVDVISLSGDAVDLAANKEAAKTSHQ